MARTVLGNARAPIQPSRVSKSPSEWLLRLKSRVARKYDDVDQRLSRLVLSQPRNRPDHNRSVSNTALCVFLAASLVTWGVQPGGIIWGAARIIALGSGAYWAGDELLRGVNPWRRALGLFVLAYLLVSAASLWP